MKSTAVPTAGVSYFQLFVFRILACIFTTAWIYFCVTTRSQVNWWLENILVIGFAVWLLRLQAHFRFRMSNLLCIFLFLFIHIYGAQTSYTYNEAGAWLQDYFHLSRNPYDRVVHFCFGLLMVFPAEDYILHQMKAPPRLGALLSIVLIFVLATLFELIEWGVAACTDTATGESYVATQGDVWDAHKDIALALLAAMIVMIAKKLLSSRVD